MGCEERHRSSLFEYEGGRPFFRSLPVERRIVHVAGTTFEIAALGDAADLLDEADFAKQFLEEDRAPYGLELWPAAIMLVEHILQSRPGDGRWAIELGCGLGLVSLAASQARWRVIATDNELTSLRFARYNADLNNTRIEAYELLDWNRPPEGRRFDRVFAADVLYQLVDHVPILRCFASLLSPGGEALVADPNRGVADRFQPVAESFGLDVEVRPATAPGPAGKLAKGRIYRLRRDRAFSVSV